MTVATCTCCRWLTPSTVAVAFNAVPPATLLSPVRLTVRLVLVAPVTVPVTPLLKVTVSLAAVVSKALPLIVMLVLVAGKLAVLEIIVSSSKAPMSGTLPRLMPRWSVAK